MSKLITEGSVVEQWQSLVSDASANCEYQLDEELESYLVFALVRYTQKSALIDSFIALEYMEGLQEKGSQQYNQLRDVADKCLLFSGLFPRTIREKITDIGYYINIGRSSYSQLEILFQKKISGLYDKLSRYFILLTDVLHSMRELNGTPIMDETEKYQFWVDFDSEYAKKSLQDFYGVIPFNPNR